MAGLSIYVGSLPEGWSEDELRRLFEEYGPVDSVTVLIDPETGLPRSFGFVMMDRAAAEAAIEALDGLEIEGSFLRVNESRDRGARPPRRKY